MNVSFSVRRHAARIAYPFIAVAALVVGAMGCDGDGVKYIGRHQVSPADADAGSAGDGLGDDDGLDDEAQPTSPGSSGCGVVSAPGLVDLRLQSSGFSRSYHVVVPEGYTPDRPYPVVLAFHARDEDGSVARERLQLEQAMPNDWALFVYPDGRVQEFTGGLVTSGWQNGPIAPEYGGTEDLEFVDQLLAELASNYCVDERSLFAVGQGWGGEFSAVLGCYSTRLRGFAQAGSNYPYFLPLDPGEQPCVGEPAAWVFHGKDDQEFALEVGMQHLDFWSQRNECSASFQPLQFGGFAADDECGALDCQGMATHFCWYTAAAGHGVPESYFASAVMGFFRDLL